MSLRCHVISWNLTRRCNLRCEHCYISAGRLAAEGREELTTEECLNVVDQICDLNRDALLILTGGEPLLRPDLFRIVAHASSSGLWVVVGTNGVSMTAAVCEQLTRAGVRGVSLSLDSARPEVHDRFRGVEGVWQRTIDGADVLARAGVPFIVQTTIGSHNLDELEDIALLASRLGAQALNLFFLVPTGRGTYLTTLDCDQYESTMVQLIDLQGGLAGKLLINSKCAPHFQRVLYQHDPRSPQLATFDGGAGGCPAGTHYLGIRPNGDVTPCPYLPAYGGNLREQSLAQIWRSSELFTTIRARDRLGGRCGACEFQQLCGGCRARAYAATGDCMAEDGGCSYQPGKHGGRPIRIDRETRYGLDDRAELVWTPDARERLEQVPGFVRGMVQRRVEAYCRERGHRRVTAELMAEIRGRVGARRGGKAPSLVRRLLAARIQGSR